MSDPWSEALAEAYASVPADKVVLYTLEFRHAAFPAPIRIVRDYGTLLEADYEGEGFDLWGHYLTLEDTAIVNPGESVIFQSLMFEVDLPEQNETKVGTLRITLDNVTQKLSQHLDAAVAVRSPIDVTYREYLADTPVIPQLIIDGLQVKRVPGNVFKLTFEAEFSSLTNKKFPNKDYQPAEYRGLRNT